MKFFGKVAMVIVLLPIAIAILPLVAAVYILKGAALGFIEFCEHVTRGKK